MDCGLILGAGAVTVRSRTPGVSLAP